LDARLVGKEGKDVLADNIFLKIARKEIPAKIVYEDEHCVAFHDITPRAPVHVLIIPRKEIRTHDEITGEDCELLGRMHLVAVQVAKQLGLDDGYRLVVNCKESAGQTVPHIHMHLLGGRDMGWPPG
jgi:histidine triad (HIT) family protein